jgi:hypothetical protein
MPNDKPEERKSLETEKTPPASEGSKPQSPRKEALRELTPEEQMALYEKDLKENDWGHQPC